MDCFTNEQDAGNSLAFVGFLTNKTIYRKYNRSDIVHLSAPNNVKLYINFPMAPV